MKPSDRAALAAGVMLISYDCLYAWACWGIPKPWFWPCLIVVMELNRITVALDRLREKPKHGP